MGLNGAQSPSIELWADAVFFFEPEFASRLHSIKRKRERVWLTTGDVTRAPIYSCRSTWDPAPRGPQLPHRVAPSLRELQLSDFKHRFDDFSRPVGVATIR